MLSEAEKKELLRTARQSLESAAKGLPRPEFKPITDTMKEKRGVFVTLKKHGELRGCIGYIQPTKALYLAVAEMAVSAGLHDPRFRPVEERELSNIDIEISVLTPLKLIGGPDDIKVGRDGIFIVKDFYSGVLLPQVAVEYDWDSLTFLQETCYKAGLPPDAWQEGAQIYTFSAEIFGEKSE
jgi:AmmeMemoRadiSam system protein A